MRRQAQRQAPSVARRLGDAVDQVVGIFSPERAYRRKQFREAMAVSGAYHGARKDRITQDWVTSSGSADADLLDDLPELRERSRDLERNDPHSSSIVRQFVDQVVGRGIRPQSTPDRERLMQAGVSEEQIDEFARRADSIFSRWAPFADVTGRLDIYGLQRLAERKLVVDGEAFLIPRMRRLQREPYLPYELGLEIVEADRVDTPTGLRRKDRIRSGIELERRTGRPVRIWVEVSHPGDDPNFRRFGRRRFWQPLRVRDETGRPGIMHLYHQLRPGQSRGVPEFAAVIELLRTLDETIEAELVTARVQACFSAFIEKADPLSFATSRSKLNDDNDRETSLQPAGIEVLGPGEKVHFGNPTRPGNTFAPFVERILRGVGAGVGMPYEQVARDWSQTTYTSGRMSLLDTQRMFACRQQLLIDRFCQPSREMLLEEAWLKGEIDAPDFLGLKDAWCRALWIPPGWHWVDPQKEAKARQTMLELGLTSRTIEAAALGRNYEDVEEQLARERRIREERGGVAPSAPAGDEVDQDGEGEAVTEEEEEQQLQEAAR